MTRDDVVIQKPEDVRFLVPIFHTSNACCGSATAYLLRRIGYRLQCRRVATPTQAVLQWVKEGKGYRGAMLPTEFKKIHPEPGAAGMDSGPDVVAHAVGITIDRIDPKGDEELCMIDPWPGVV